MGIIWMEEGVLTLVMSRSAVLNLNLNQGCDPMSCVPPVLLCCRF